MSTGRAIVREAVERIDGVSKAWFEWRSDGDQLGTVLVVEIEGDTDPESATFDLHTIKLIDQEVAHILSDRTTMQIRGLRIVPKHR